MSNLPRPPQTGSEPPAKDDLSTSEFLLYGALAIGVAAGIWFFLESGDTVEDTSSTGYHFITGQETNEPGSSFGSGFISPEASVEARQFETAPDPFARGAEERALREAQAGANPDDPTAHVEAFHEFLAPRPTDLSPSELRDSARQAYEANPRGMTPHQALEQANHPATQRYDDVVPQIERFAPSEFNPDPVDYRQAFD